MARPMPRARFATLFVLAAASGVALAQQSPDALLARISDAISDISYRGTMIRMVDGRIETMRVLHRNRDGLVREKLVALDGEGREFLRNGNEMICLYPARRLKMVETGLEPANPLVRLPTGAQDLGRYYVLEDIGAARVAGRDAREYFVRPRDALRYGHRLWIDADTLLPLRMQLIGPRRVFEEIRFTDIEIGIDIPDAAFASDIDSSEFDVIRASTGPTPPAPSTRANAAQARGNDWPDELSPGFRLRAAETQIVRINGHVAQRIVFSDGLATISVFVAARGDGNDDPVSHVARVGAAHSFRRQVGRNTITLVGEVPEQTLRMSADGAARQLIGATAADGPGPD